jgi:hypothetical protein
VNGYAASARIVRTEVRSRVNAHRPSSWLVAADVDPLAEMPSGTPLVERLEEWRIIWRQTTFFLFDPDSWR